MNKSFDRIKKNIDLIKVISCSKNKKKLRNTIIQCGSRDLIQSICECILNSLNGNITLGHEDIKKLEKYKKPLRKLLKNISLKTKKKILIQNGGFLQILLPSVITGLASIIGSVIDKI